MEILSKINKKGLTMLEVLMVVVLISMVFGAAAAALIPLMRFFAFEQTRVRVVEDVNTALDWLEKDALQANDVSITTTTTANDTITFTVTDYADPTRPSETRQYRQVGTNLERVVTPSVGAPSTIVITTILDVDTPPVYVATSFDNTVAAAITTEDPVTGTIATKRSAFILRCRRR
ncbi:MAG: type II secretion system protein [Candidatus Omnitrophota bacterium]